MYCYEKKAEYIEQFEDWAEKHYPGGPDARGAVAEYVRSQGMDHKFTIYLGKSSGEGGRKKKKSEKKVGWRYPAERKRIMGLAGSKKTERLMFPPRTGAKYPDMERQLRDKWKERRAQKRKVSPRWLQVQSRNLMQKLHPSEKWKGSRGWMRKFCKRMQPPLKKRKVTHVKKKTLQEKLPAIQKYHKGLRSLVQSAPNPITGKRKREDGSDMTALDIDIKYGRFKKERRISKDQVPLPLVVKQDETLEEEGTEVVHVRTPGEALKKRQFTAELSFAAGRTPAQQPKPGLVCRGTGTRISEAEKAAYHPDVHVYFQRCAWVDRPTGEAIARDLVADEEAAMGLED